MELRAELEELNAKLKVLKEIKAATRPISFENRGDEFINTICNIMGISSQIGEIAVNSEEKSCIR